MTRTENRTTHGDYEGKKLFKILYIWILPNQHCILFTEFIYWERVVQVKYHKKITFLVYSRAFAIFHTVISLKFIEKKIIDVLCLIELDQKMKFQSSEIWVLERQKWKKNDSNKGDIKITLPFWDDEVKWICRCLKNIYILSEPHFILFVNLFFGRLLKQFYHTAGFLFTIYLTDYPLYDSYSHCRRCTVLK